MRYYNGLANSVFDFLLAPLAFESPWPGLIVVSLAAAAGLLLIFKLSSNQERIRRKKKVVFARVMELLLFRHDLGVSLTACGRILATQMAYLGELALPFGIAAVMCTLLIAQLACWFECRPFRVGEPIVLEVELGRDAPPPREFVAAATPGLANVKPTCSTFPRPGRSIGDCEPWRRGQAGSRYRPAASRSGRTSSWGNDS